VSSGLVTTIEPSSFGAPGGAGEGRELAALVIAWCPAEPRRVGEVALLPEGGQALVLGRGEARAGRLAFVRQRPGANEPTAPLASPGISREQLRVRAHAGGVLVEVVGRCPALADGKPVERCLLLPGDTLLLKGQLLLLCVRRPAELAPLRDFPAAAVRAFGEPDAFGLTGESPAAWRLRDALAFTAKAGAHALLVGASGTGKELSARALHALSARAGKPFVARSAATFPTELVDAELFGNARGYPNPGMPERPGLVGAADGGTLFLDEIGELPSSLQSHLLRVLDGGGEYHRLGEPMPRRADVRLVAATNRDPAELKHDLVARMPLRLALPGLDARVEDVPLLARRLLLRAAGKSPETAGRFVVDGEPRLDGALVAHLVARRFTTHVRELEGLLWRAMAASRGDVCALSPELAADAPASREPPRAAPPARRPGGPERAGRSHARRHPRRPRPREREPDARGQGARPLEPLRALPPAQARGHRARRAAGRRRRLSL
jgi:two-component system nitrogen regulation response regulator GlnG/two-component system response regulator HydG